MIIDTNILNLKRKAIQGCVPSKIELARIYSIGESGLPKDINQSLKIWLDLASDLGKIRTERYNTSELCLHIGETYLEQGNKYLAKKYLLQATEEIIYAYEEHEWDKMLKEFQIEKLLAKAGYKWRPNIRTYC